MPHQDHLFEHLKANAPFAIDMIQRDTHVGKAVIICGAGPSLAQEHETIRRTPAPQVWACNSALPYMKRHKLPVSHGFAVDQGEEMLLDWPVPPDVTYLVASSIHPQLTAHLLKHKRRVKWFHNYLGIKNPEGWTPPPNWNRPSPDAGYEMFLYQTLFKPSVQVGYGLNSVPRAICLALWMGFRTITVFGADCATSVNAAPMPLADDPAYPGWLDTLTMYADGRTARVYGDKAVMSQGLIDGRIWTTRADMLISALHLVDLARNFGGPVTPSNPAGQLVVLKGDTLPNAIKDKPPEFFARMPKLTGEGSVSGFVPNAPLALSNSEVP